MEFLNAIIDTAWPMNYVALAGVSLLAALAAWAIRRDILAALVLGFSIVVPLFVIIFFVRMLLIDRDPSIPLRAEIPFIVAEAILVLAILLGCMVIALNALVRGQPIARGERVVSALIIGHTLHVHLVHTLFYLSSVTWAYWVARAWDQIFGP